MLDKRARGKPCYHAAHCKFSAVAISIMVGIVWTLMISCSSIPLEKGKDPIYGTWRNTEYLKGNWVWRFTYEPDGLTRSWDNAKPADQPSTYEGQFTIEKKWTDAKGNTWYRTAERVCLAPYSELKTRREYGLIKVSFEGNILEGEWSSLDSPKEFGALGNVHFGFSRQ